MVEPTKCVGLILDIGCKSNDLKSASESLDEVAAWVTKDGMQGITEKQVKTVAKLADHSD